MKKGHLEDLFKVEGDKDVLEEASNNVSSDRSVVSSGEVYQTPAFCLPWDSESIPELQTSSGISDSDSDSEHDPPEVWQVTAVCRRMHCGLRHHSLSMGLPFSHNFLTGGGMSNNGSSSSESGSGDSMVSEPHPPQPKWKWTKGDYKDLLSDGGSMYSNSHSSQD